MSAAPVLSRAVETPSGKGRGDENFPVGSWLIRRDLRPHVHAFYRFAREADDVADNPQLAADDKVRRLDRMGAVLDGAPGEDAPAAAAMRASLAATGVTAQHCHDVLRAFRLDATKLRYRDWDDLMEYCRYSAVAGRAAAARSARRGARDLARLGCAVQRAAGAEPSAGLRRRLSRPRPRLSAAATISPRAARGSRSWRRTRASPALRAAIDRLLDGTDALIAEARVLPPARAEARACAANARSSSVSPSGWRGGCGAAIRWRCGSSSTRADFAAAFLCGFWRGRAMSALRAQTAATTLTRASDPRPGGGGRHLVLLGDAAAAARRGATRCSRSMRSAA